MKKELDSFKGIINRLTEPDSNGDILMTGLFKNIRENSTRNLVNEFDEKMEKYVIENLERLGFKFESKDEFYSFVSLRVKRIGYSDRPGYYEFYVLHDSGKSELLGGYCLENIFTNYLKNK